MDDSEGFIQALIYLLEAQISDNLSGYRYTGLPEYWIGRVFDSEELYNSISNLIEEYK